MARKSEGNLLGVFESIQEEVHENNVMLRQICHVINIHLARYHQENNEDFDRNVLANLISGGFAELKGLR